MIRSTARKYRKLPRRPGQGRRAPWVDRVIFRTLPEDAARAAELEAGGIDLDIDVSPQHIARLAGRGVKVTTIPRLSSNHIGFNVEKDVFKDVRVRKAVANAVNRQEIVQFVMKGQADISHGFLHPVVPGASSKDQMKRSWPSLRWTDRASS